MSKVYTVVDNDRILAAFPDEEAARAFFSKTMCTRDNDREDILANLGILMHTSEYYKSLGPNLAVRDEDDFLSLVTLTYINKSR